MLVLTRKVDEEILIGDSITVKVVEVFSARVRIGVKAPQNLRLLHLSETTHQPLNTPRVSHSPEVSEEFWVRSLKRDQIITVGPDIALKVVRIRRGQVRIGIQAPRSCEVRRAEAIKQPA